MIHIVLAHESKLVCDGLAMLLDAEQGMCVLAQGRTGRDALSLCRLHKPHIVVIAASFPDMDALKFMSEFHGLGLGTRVAVIGLNGSSEYGARLLLCGACGISSMDMPGEGLARLIRGSLAQDCFVSEEIKEDTMAALVTVSHKRQTNLTQREMQVVSGYARGRKRALIAADLKIDPRTVETHRRRAMKKLGVTSNAELYKTALRMGVVET